MDVILIAGDDESVLCGFAEMVGDVEHAEVVELPMPSDILERVAAGEISCVVFCPAALAPSPKDATDRRHKQQVGNARFDAPAEVVRGD